MKLEEKIYAKITRKPDNEIEEGKKSNPKDHTTLTPREMGVVIQKAASLKKASQEKKAKKSVPPEEYRKVESPSDAFQIVAPKTTEASCHYGSGTKWCTAGSKESNMFDRYYNRHGVTLYYILPKSVDAGRAGDMSDDEVEDFNAQLDDLFEGKLEDLKKKYPQWVLSDYEDWNKTYSGPRGIDKMSQEDPSGKNKYLAWMVKNANDIVVLDDDGKVSGRRELFARNRVTNLIKKYHELLPFIGREEKPGKEKKPTKTKDRTRYDKVALVFNANGRMEIFDAEDKQHDIDFLDGALKAWGVEEDKIEMMVDVLLDTLEDDLEKNPNPAASRQKKYSDLMDKLTKEWESNYHDKVLPLHNEAPDKPSAHAYMSATEVEAGRLVANIKNFVYLPIPDEIGGYEKMTGHEEFRGNDRSRNEQFVSYLRMKMDLPEYSKMVEGVALHTFNSGKEKYDNGEVPVDRVFKAKIREPKLDITGRKGKQEYIIMDMRWSVMITDPESKIPAEEMDRLYAGAISDLRNFSHSLSSDLPATTGPAANEWPEKMDVKAFKEFTKLAKEWIKNHPREAPEKELVGTRDSIDAIMGQLGLEESAMKLEERILVKLLGEELLQEVSLDDAMSSLGGKAGKKIIKSYNFDQGKDPGDDYNRLHKKLHSVISLTYTPADVVPGNISRTHQPEKHKSIQDSNRAQIIFWWLRYLKTDTELRDRILSGQYPLANRDAILIRQNFETFFQHPRHMKVSDIGQIKTKEMLDDVVKAGQASIDAENDKKMANDAVGRTEFFAGGYKLDDKGQVLRDEQGIPQFRRSKDGWVIAAAHGKGAACLLGKKTSWCTASPGLDYFNQYYGGEDDPLFYIHTPGDTRDDPEDDGDRFQFHYGSKQFMDVTDTPVRGDEFEILHGKLKDVLKDNGFEGRFDTVFDYEMIDYDSKLKEIMEAAEQRLDHGNRISLAFDTYDDYEDMTINVEATISFIYDSGEFDGKEDLDMYELDALRDAFQDANQNLMIGNQEDPAIMQDLMQYIDIHVSGRTVKVTIECYGSFYGESGIEGAEDFFNNVEYGPDNKYEACQGKIRATLIEGGVLPFTKYDTLLYGQGENAEVQVYDPEDDGREVEDKTAKELQDEFEEQYKNLHLISFDPENGEMEFSIPYPPPEEVQQDKTQIIGDRPSNDGAQKILRRGLNVFQKLLQRQPSLPGMEEQDTDDIIDRIMYVSERNDLVGYMIVYKTTAKMDISVELSKYSEEELDAIVDGTRLFDKHWKLWQASLQSATERWIKMNPQSIRRDNNFDADRKLAGVQAGEPVGATLGAPQPAQEAKDYQNSPAKKQHSTRKGLLIRVPGKTADKGHKLAPTKRSKSAPPGSGA
jgi:hypothetical protein